LSLPGRFLRCLLLLALLVPAMSASRALSAAVNEEALEAPRSKGQRAIPNTTGPIITDTTIPQSLGTATLFLPTFWALQSGNFSPNWRRVSAGGNYQSLSPSAQLYVGVAPRTEVYAVVPYLHNWAGKVNQPAPTGQRNANFGGLGDVSLTGKYLLLTEEANLPAVSAILTTTFPTGHHRHLNPGNLGTDQPGRGAYTFTTGLNLFKYLPPLLLYGNLWYNMSTAATVAGARTYYPDSVTLNLALEYPLPVKRLVFLFEFVSGYDAGRLIGRRANQPAVTFISVLPALEFIASKDWSFDIGVLIDLFGKNTGYYYTPNFSVFYNF
jgi:hypothetical protein